MPFRSRLATATLRASMPTTISAASALAKSVPKPSAQLPRVRSFLHLRMPRRLNLSVFLWNAQVRHSLVHGYDRGDLWPVRSEEHTSELQSRLHRVGRLLPE